VAGQKIVHFYTIRLERIPDLRVIIAPGSRGMVTVPGRDYYERQAATLLKYAKLTSDPDIAAALLEIAADLDSRAESTEPSDSSPHAPDVERPARP
jgi:hypothetical protein